MKRELLLAGVLLCAAGCTSGGGVQVRKVAFVLPAGWTKAESDDKEVSLGVPPGWRQGANNLFGTSNPFANGMPTDSSSGQMTPDEKKKMDELASGMSEFAKQDEEKNLEKLKEKGIILHVVSTGKPVIGEELTRFYIKKKTNNTNWTWPETDQSEQDCFISKQTATEVKLPIGLAHKMQATFQKTDGSYYTQVSYLVPSGRDLYILRLITVESAEVVTNIEKEVAQTFRIN